MKITIERKWKKEGYTIGCLYLNDMQMLCDTLEPVDRGLVNYALPGKVWTDEWQKCKSDANYVKLLNKKGTTAIPKGSYKATMEVSSKFHARRLFLRDVPGFTGIMIHEGNRPKDTAGCILVGRNTAKGMVTDSRKCLGIINEAVMKAIEAGEQIVVCVK